MAGIKVSSHSQKNYQKFQSSQSKINNHHEKVGALALAATIGMTFVLLGCLLPASKVWWPLLVILFYLLSPLPTLIARRYTEDSGTNSNPCLELAIFITMGIVVSSFALPIVLARSNGVIEWSACYLTLAGNVVVYLTIVGYFMTIDQDDADYSMW